MNRDLTVHNSSLAEQNPLRLPPAIERASEHARAKFIEFFVIRSPTTTPALRMDELSETLSTGANLDNWI